MQKKKIDSWQFPQGGIDFGESPIKAAKRELYEEVGIKKKDVKLISSTDKWFKYDVPHEKRKNHFLKKRFRGQKQKWFMFKLMHDVKIHFENDPDNEFIDFQWVPYWYPLYAIVEFKREVYRLVLNELKDNFCTEMNND